MELTLDGKPIEFDTVTPWMRELLGKLDALPDGQIFTISQLAPKVGAKEKSLRDVGARPELREYTFYERGWFDGARVWGNKKSICMAREKVAARKRGEIL